MQGSVSPGTKCREIAWHIVENEDEEDWVAMIENASAMPIEGEPDMAMNDMGNNYAQNA